MKAIITSACFFIVNTSLKGHVQKVILNILLENQLKETNEFKITRLCSDQHIFRSFDMAKNRI